MKRIAIGAAAQQTALAYLKKQGLSLITQNFSCAHGEIDIIMQDGEDLVFVEVRYRSSQDYGGSIASVDRPKQRKIRRTAARYLAQQYGDILPLCRFDLLLLDGELRTASLVWYKNVEIDG